jgi:23S rRNA (cytosine1962-C5)-methyltransferase
MLERLFPSFPPERILHQDADLVVIDKPPGMSTSTGATTSPDDAVARLAAHLAAPYLAAPLLLERDASGVLVLLRRKEHNAAFSRSIERGDVRICFLTSIDSSRQQQRAPGVRPVGRVAGGSLIELTPAQPRAAAARALLGAPPRDQPAGPGARGPGGAGGQPARASHKGQPARRPPRDQHAHRPPADQPPLHASSITFPHPATGATLTVTAPPPAWALQPGGTRNPPSLQRALGDAAERRYGLARRGRTTAFRLLHDTESPIPGVAVDLYGDWAVAHLSSPDALARRDEILDAIAAVGARGVYAKLRPRQANTLAETRRDDVAPALPLRGEPAPDPLVVIEGGDRFITRLGDGLSTGIFLDQRDNRALVREISSGKRVLNLFAYACAFTVSAAAGGASATVSVDISRSALAWGEENLRENGLHDPARHRFVVDEAVTYLRRCAVRGDRFDLVLLDPPSYATTKSTRFAAEHDYGVAAQAAIAVLSPGGSLLACTNHRGIGWPRFRSFLRDAAAAAGRPVTRLRELPPPFDFPAAPGEEPHLKTALLSVG